MRHNCALWPLSFAPLDLYWATLFLVKLPAWKTCYGGVDGREKMKIRGGKQFVRHRTSHGVRKSEFRSYDLMCSFGWCGLL